LPRFFTAVFLSATHVLRSTMRYSAVFAILFAAATAAPALALPAGLGSRATEDETLYGRHIQDNVWARDAMPRTTPHPLPKPPPHPYPTPPPRPKPPQRGRSLSDYELEERDLDEESLFERSFDDEGSFWVRDMVPRGPYRPFPQPLPKPPRPVPRPQPRPSPRPPKRSRSLKEKAAEVLMSFHVPHRH